MMFPMRSKVGKCLTLMAYAGSLPALASCDGPAVDQNDHVNRSQISSSANLTPVASPNAAPVVPHPAPVTDSLHFDLYCELNGRVISDGDPEVVRGTYPANVSTWRDHPHFTINLQTMLVCELGGCEDHGPSRISGATADRITLDDEPGLKTFILRRNWRYEQRQEDMGRVSVTRGQCRRGAFSGFPPAPAQPSPAG
jgi:hypothetical protein